MKMLYVKLIDCIMLKRAIYLAAVLMLLISPKESSGQGTVRGQVKDERGEAVIGASIVLKSNRSIGVTTDLDGNYSLKITSSQPEVIIVSFISYQPIEETVNPKNDQVLIKNFFLVPATHGIKEVEVTAKAVRAREYYTEMVKKNAAITMDYISSETMKRTGDNNVTSALSRVTGVSTNGNFITVRGIGDRYIKTTVNGLRIPTLDPFTNNIKLDIFPASLVDNIFITKTASPDLPGDFSGAYLSVETKDYPDQLTLSVESTFGYNQQSTFKNVISSTRSSTDWLGYDNGFRNHEHDNYVRPMMDVEITHYHEFVALGMGEYFNSMGITENTPWIETYDKLAYVRLNLLAPAEFDDPNAVAAAASQYENGSYKAEAFGIINAGVPASSKSLPNNWNTVYNKAPINFSQSVSIGNQVNFLNKPLGFIAGFRYGNSIAYDPAITANRQALPDGVNITVPVQIKGETGRETNGWSGLAAMAYKLNANNSISFMFMPNFIGVNNARYTVDYAEPSELFLSRDQFYESRRQMIYQFKSEHFLPGSKTKIEFSSSYTDGKSEAPDFKKLSYTSNRNFTNYGIGQDVSRAFRYLEEKIVDSKISAEFPLNDSAGLARKIKIGGAYQFNDRNSEQFEYNLRYGRYQSPSLGNVPIEEFFSLDKFDMRPGFFNGIPYNTLDLYYVRTDYPSNHTIGDYRVYSGFAMTDYTLIPRIRISGGLRVEKSKIFTDAFRYDSLQYSADDPRRQNPGEPLTLRPANIDEINFLPSINLIYKIRNDDASPVNARFNFSQSVARPSIRELTDVIVYDYELRALIYGNSELKTVRINNYDIRLESYFKSGDNLSLSFFYKDFRNHIEVVDAPLGYTWTNVDKSKVMGIELEGKKVLSKNFQVMANITLADSKTEYLHKAILLSNGIRTYVPIGDVSRTMYGQAPYVLNGMISYNADKIGLSVTLNYNVQGPRLVISSFEKEFEVYELPRNVIDGRISKKLGNHFVVNVTVRDILDTPVRRSYNRDNWSLDYDRYRYGTNYSLGISYKL